MNSIKTNHRGAEARRNLSACEDFVCVLCVSAFIILLLFPLNSFAVEAGVPDVNLDFGNAAIRRGEELFKTTCQVCHSLKYLGVEASMSAEDSEKAFGKAPPDLSLMAKARGRGDKGAIYIYALLISYNDTPEKNSVFPNIAMPPVLSREDTEPERKAKDVAAYLFYASDPGFNQRNKLGRYVLGYMGVLTALLYFVNRRTWMKIKKK